MASDDLRTGRTEARLLSVLSQTVPQSTSEGEGHKPDAMSDTLTTVLLEVAKRDAECRCIAKHDPACLRGK